jgi:uncharacterized membrane protein
MWGFLLVNGVCRDLLVHLILVLLHPKLSYNYMSSTSSQGMANKHIYAYKHIFKKTANVFA